MREEKEKQPSSKNLFVKGLNWGNIEITQKRLLFNSESKDWFQIPIKSLSNVQQGSNKNEITLEFNNIEEDIEESAICELRLFVPDIQDKEEENQNSEENEQKKENNEKNDNNEEEEVEEDIPVKTKGEQMKEKIIKIANIGTVSGSIAHLPGIQMATPRGKFDLYFMKDSLKIHGQSHNYQIQIKNITKVFLVPKIDGHFYFLIVKLRSPLTQGNTSYPFLIFQLKSEAKIEVDLQIPENEPKLKENLEKLENPLTGLVYDVLAKLFNNIVNIGIVIPSKNYKFNKVPYIKCTHKTTAEGVLYPLEQSLLFVHKPVLHIEHKDIKEVKWERLNETGLTQRSFDMTIIKNKKNEKIQFNGLEREVMDELKSYLDEKKIKLNAFDDNNKNVEMSNYTKRRRAAVTDEMPELPSEEELGDDDFSEGSYEIGEEDSEDEGEEDEDYGEEESKSDRKKKKKEKNKKKEKKEKKDKKEKKGDKKEKKKKSEDEDEDMDYKEEEDKDSDNKDDKDEEEENKNKKRKIEE